MKKRAAHDSSPPVRLKEQHHQQGETAAAVLSVGRLCL
jgi:hypothetical protein